MLARIIGLVCLGVWSQLLIAAPVMVISVSKGFSSPLRLQEPAETIAIGDPGIIGVNTLKPDLLMINGQDTGATSLTVFNKSGGIAEYRIQVVNDIFQLRSMIAAVEKKVTVEDLNGIIVLKGTVPTPTALARVLTIADRFVTGTAEPPQFSVISDHGGVLSGNLAEADTGIDEEIVGVSPDPRIAIPQVNVGGQGQAGGGGGGGAGGGGGRNGANGNITRALTQPLMPIKGNLAQNISRGEVIMVGKGKVMSMIKVARQPKVEIQMQIIGIDRNKTDSYGLDWRLDAETGGKTVTVGSVLGDVSPSGGNSPTQLLNNGADFGSSSLFAFVNNPGKYFLSGFMRFLQQKGAAKTLSNPLVTAVSGESASFLVGGNVPIPVQTAIAGNIGGGAAVATNVRFIQFGLKLIVRPTVLENGKISIVLDQSISEPDYTQSITLLGARIPGFNQRSVSTLTESASGETWAVAGLLSEENAKNSSQVPWLSQVPVLGWLFKNTSDAKTRNELMILVNARVIEGDNQTKTSFEEEGDLAPTERPADESTDTPAPEESSEPPKVFVPARTKPVIRPQSTPLGKPGKKPQTIDLPTVLPPPVIRDENRSGSGPWPAGPSAEPETALPTIIKPDRSGQSIITLNQPSGNVSRSVEGKVILYQEFKNVAAKKEHLDYVASRQDALITSPINKTPESDPPKTVVASQLIQKHKQTMNKMDFLGQIALLAKVSENTHMEALTQPQLRSTEADSVTPDKTDRSD